MARMSEKRNCPLSRYPPARYRLCGVEKPRCRFSFDLADKFLQPSRALRFVLSERRYHVGWYPWTGLGHKMPSLELII